MNSPIVRALSDDDVRLVALWRTFEHECNQFVPVEIVLAFAHALLEKEGEIVVTTDQTGRCVAVTRQDAEGKILSVIWEAKESAASAVPEGLAYGLSHAEFHDKAWALYHAKTFEDTQLAKVNIHTIRTVFDAVFDSIAAAPTEAKSEQSKEPTFLLRAQDALAADAVRYWAERAAYHGVSKNKIDSALRLAEEIDKWPNKKVPD